MPEFESVVSAPGDAPDDGHWLTRLERLLGRLTGPLASIGVIGMLIASSVTVLDVLLRWFAKTAIVGLNEIIALAFAVAVSACMPSGISRGVNLTVDVFEGIYSPRVTAWLRVVGAASLLAFFVILTWRLFVFGEVLTAQARTTVMLDVEQGPFIVAAAILIGIGAVVQTVITLNLFRRALAVAGPGEPAGGTRRLADFLVKLLGVAVLALAVVGFIDFGILANWVQSNIAVALVLMVLFTWACLLALIPLAAVLGLVGLVGLAFFIGFSPGLNAFSAETVGFLSNYQVASLPLFLMMGSFAAVAGVADDLFRLAQAIFGGFRGGLAMATIGGCAGFGAVTGSSLATVATFGRVALPAMKERGYAPELSMGCVAAGGTLGALIPPSAPLIIFALLTEASIGQLFVAAVIPGLLAVALYLAAIAVTIAIRPRFVPAPARPQLSELITAIGRSGAVVLLFGTVIGGLYTGIFTATEAAAVGAFGAFLIALFRGKLRARELGAVMAETTSSTAMVYALIFGVVVFSFFVNISALPEQIASLVGGLNMAPIMIIVVFVVIYIFFGFVMDSFTIMIITIPVVTPVVLGLGYDLVWWGILNLMVIEIGQITPPFGLNIFVLKSMNADTRLATIYRGVMPFCIADFVKLILVLVFPALALWLPSTMYG